MGSPPLFALGCDRAQPPDIARTPDPGWIHAEPRSVIVGTVEINSGVGPASVALLFNRHTQRLAGNRAAQSTEEIELAEARVIHDDAHAQQPGRRHSPERDGQETEEQPIRPVMLQGREAVENRADPNDDWQRRQQQDIPVLPGAGPDDPLRRGLGGAWSGDWSELSVTARDQAHPPSPA